MAKWKKINPEDLTDLAGLRDEETDRPFATAADRILSGISAERVIREIKGLLVGDDYLWAEATLRGILESIERTEAVTQGQWDTIERIVEKRQDRRQPKRRWR